MPSVAIIGSRGYPSYYGGFETAVRRLAPFLSDAGWDVTVYGRPGATRVDDPTTHPAVRRVDTKGIEAKSLSTLTFGFSSTLHARRERPDVALIMNVANGYWIPLLNRRGIPSLVNVDGIEWDRDKWGRLAKAVFHRGAVSVAKHATNLVFDARAIADRWGSEFNRDGVFIPYGGEPPRAHLPVVEGLHPRTYALFVARLVPENTVREFLRAARLIAATHDVVIVGSSGYGGALDDEARELAANHARVRWLGHVSDDLKLHSLWQHAGVYFHGHSVGGTNPALVQAMACGAPVIARDTVYNREVLGAAGRYVPPNPQEIAESVVRSLRDREWMVTSAQANRDRAVSHYSWESVLAEYDAALRQLVSTSRPRS